MMENREQTEILWGLSDADSEEAIRKKAFELIGKIRFIPAATLGDTSAECRILDFNLLSDGSLYFMTSRGKPVYRQLQKRPQLMLNTLIDGRYSLRMSAWAAEEERQEIWKEFFEKNPGTKLMYRKNFDMVALFRIERGEGEMFHLYESEKIRRVRFGFGGEEKRPMSYYISDACTGCGSCQENCVEAAIYEGADGRFHIRDMDCDDCGICYSKCPQADKALICRLKDL